MSREEALKDWLPIIRQKVKGTEVYEEALEMAIKALEQEHCEVSQGLVKDSQGFSQEPCGDCISREAVSKLLNEGWRKGIYPSGAIMALPSVTPQKKWIPVSEKLPEEAGKYLCSYDDDDVSTSYFDIRMNEFNVFHEQVTAWMYLPESYKAESEDKE